MIKLVSSWLSLLLFVDVDVEVDVSGSIVMVRGWMSAAGKAPAEGSAAARDITVIGRPPPSVVNVENNKKMYFTRRGPTWGFSSSRF